MTPLGAAVAKNAAMLVGAFIGAACAEKIFDSRATRHDNGNFAKADAEVTGGMTMKSAQTTELNAPSEFHRDPPEDSKVAYTVAQEPDATL